MKRFHLVLMIATFCCSGWEIVVATNLPGDRALQPFILIRSGQIAGTVDFCGPQGNAGTEVNLLGRAFRAVTDASGVFVINYVPEGDYQVEIRVPGSAPITLPVHVDKGKSTSIGTVSICPDSDNDGFPADVDCNDNNPTINPNAVEVCDGLDNDCNGQVDEVSCPTCTDEDNDGFFAQVNCGTLVDCDDDNNLVNPGTAEICDGLDNDCNGTVDDNFDLDADGFTACGGDCNDSDGSINPNAPEVCDGVDNNCDLQVDEDFVSLGLGQACSVGEGLCTRTGTLVCATDQVGVECNAIERPPEPEACDGIDNDCDGVIDEPEDLNPPLCLNQTGVCAGSQASCGGSSGFLPCGPAEFGPNFETVETTCDSLDNDCDGLVDEDPSCGAVNCGNGALDAGEDCDLGANNGNPGMCCNTNCTFLPTGTLCREPATVCETRGFCTGTSASCPTDPGINCDDGQFCTGSEFCDPAVGCVSPGDPCPGDGGLNCADSCDEATDTCTANDPEGSACTGGQCDGAGLCVSTP